MSNENETYGERLIRELKEKTIKKLYFESVDLLNSVGNSVTSEDYRDGWSNAVQYIDWLEETLSERTAQLWEQMLLRNHENHPNFKLED